MDLVVMSLEPWDGVWRRNQYLISGLLRTDPDLRVLFVEPAVDPLHDLWTGHRPRPGRRLRRVPVPGAAGRLWAYQPTKWLPRRLDPGQDTRAARAVLSLARHLRFTNPVLWVNDPSAASVMTASGWPTLYDITDDWLEADRSEAAHARLVRDEGLLMRDARAVVVCSQGLVETKGAQRDVLLIPNAVDVGAYRVPQPRPDDLPDGPVALYLGTIHRDRMDVELCVETAEALRGRGTLVLVGPAPLVAADTTALLGAGVVLLGPKDRSVVPAYLQHADVLVVPHVVTPFTDSLDPIKLYEYAAVGRPVVSTAVAGFRDSAHPQVTVATRHGFASAVCAALPASYHFPEGANAPVESWENRVEAMADVIARAIEEPSGGDRRSHALRLVIDVLSAPAESGGMRTYAEQVICAWREAPGAEGDELIVHGEPWTRSAFAGLAGVRTVVLPDPSQVRRIAGQWFRTALIFRTEKADAVLSLGPVVTGLVPRQRRACVVHDWRHVKRPEEFSLPTRLYRRVWRHSVRTAGAVFAISRKTQRETLEQVPGARVAVVENGMDHLRRAEERHPATANGVPRIVTFAHRRHKRPELVIGALSLLDPSAPVELVIMGAKADYAAELKQLAKGLGVEHKVQVPGFVTDDRYRQLLGGAHAVVVASTDEGYGLPVAEAASAGAHAIVTEDSGLGEIHGDLVRVAKADPADLARVIAVCLGEPRVTVDPRGLRTWRDTAAGLRAGVAASLEAAR